MRKPNELAMSVLKKAADDYAKIADVYDQMSDCARRYAVAMREGDMEKMVEVHQTLHGGGDLKEICRSASQSMKLIDTADPEWRMRFALELDRQVIAKASDEEVALMMLTHTMMCDHPKTCETHRMLEVRVAQALNRR